MGIGNLNNDGTSGVQDLYESIDSKGIFYDLQGYPTKNPQKGKLIQLNLKFR